MDGLGRLIVLSRGTLVNVGPERPVGRIGWSVITVDRPGNVVLAFNNGGSSISYHDMAAEELLWRNPRYLADQWVVHPSPPDGMAKVGWRVERGGIAIDEVTLEQAGTISRVAAHDVVAANRDDLVARLRIDGDS